MCNTRSNVYLQSMKTYTLSVNTLMRNLTLERHESGSNTSYTVGNATTKLLFEVFLLALHLLRLRICFIFNIDLSSLWFSPCWFSSTQIYSYTWVLSSTTFTYSYVFLFESLELSACDRTRTSLCFLLKSIYPNHMHSIETVECLRCVLVSRRYRDKH